jgi:hypothetical protein
MSWAAFIIGSAIPQIQTINGLIGAIGVMQFTYTFPPLLRFGYDVISDAMVADKPYDVKEGCYRRIDSWNQWSRWKRASVVIHRNCCVLMDYFSGAFFWSMVLQTFQLSIVPS